MATVNIPLEVPADCGLTVEEVVERVKEYVRNLVDTVSAREKTYEMPMDVFERLMARSMRQIENGEVFTQEEMEKMVASW